MKLFNLKNNNEHISLSQFETFIIALKEIPTTGYLWEMDNLPDGINLVETILRKKNTELVGAAAQKEFVLMTSNSISGDLVIKHCRPWDKSDCIDTFTLKIEVL